MSALTRGKPIEADMIEAVADSPQVYALAALVPTKDDRTPGPARRYHEVLVVFYLTLAGLLGSHHHSARLMETATHWQRLCTGAKHAGISLPACPPKRWNCQDARNRLLKAAGDDPTQGLVEELRAEFASGAREIAKLHGALAKADRRDYLNPPRGNTIVADGKVVSGMYGEKARERRQGRGDKVAGELHGQGGDKRTKVHGLKFWHSSVRPDIAVNSRLYLDMRYVPEVGYGGEAGIGTSALLDLITAEPGANVLCYDGALRGTHLQKLASAGYQVFSPTHEATAKPRALKQVTDCACGKPHRLIAVNGYAAERQIGDTGASIDTRLEVAKLHATGPVGTARWYQNVVLSCGNTHRIRGNTLTADGKALMERLRQSAKDENDPTALYNRIYGRREDAEAANNILERTLHGGRAISQTPVGQFLVMLGHALGRNAHADLLRRREQTAATGPPTAA